MAETFGRVEFTEDRERVTTRKESEFTLIVTQPSAVPHTRKGRDGEPHPSQGRFAAVKSCEISPKPIRVRVERRQRSEPEREDRRQNRTHPRVK